MAQSWIHEAQQAIGYSFRQPQLIEEALTHKSHVNEIKDQPHRHYERLEFLGDAVLALIISECLASMCPESTEGELSKLKAQLVSEATLATVARRIELGRLLRLGRGEELTKGREKNSLLADALEAIIAAIYLDGGLAEVQAFVLRVFVNELDEVLKQQQGEATAITQDYKTELQEWSQRRFESLPQYVTVRETGPDHQKTFEVQLSIQGDIVGMGVGRSKKEAEQMAAKQALEQVRRTPSA